MKFPVLKPKCSGENKSGKWLGEELAFGHVWCCFLLRKSAASGFCFLTLENTTTITVYCQTDNHNIMWTMKRCLIGLTWDRTKSVR